MTPFPEYAIPCLPRGGYTVSRVQATRRLDALQGRPRYRLHDTAPSYNVGVTLDLDDSQFSLWQSFWASLNGGADWFLMNLAVAGPIVECQCHASGSFAATRSEWGRWAVTLNLEAVPT